MASFVSKSACRGVRPSHLSSRRSFRRPTIISHLLRERQVPRFLIAPDGFGKTALAAEYAETLFAYQHVFWFTCESPCFIRDLDSDSLVRGMLAADDHPRLAVFDDVPLLDDERAAQFSLVVDSLLDIDCEVVVCVRPSADSYSHLQRDRIRLSARDMLLSDSELYSLGGVSRGFGEDDELTALRIPAISWGAGDDVAIGFLRGIAREDVPADYLRVVMSMLIMVRGSLDDLAVVGSLDDEMLDIMVRDHPYLRVDRVSESFEAAQFAIDDIASAFRGRVEAIAAGSVAGERDGLAIAWADSLHKNGFHDRSCQVIRRFCSQRNRAGWLLDNADELYEAGCILESLDALNSIGNAPARMHRVSLARAKRYLVLNEVRSALLSANRCVVERSADDDVVAQALVMIARHGDSKTAAKAEVVIDAMLSEAGEFAFEPAIDPSFDETLAEGSDPLIVELDQARSRYRDAAAYPEDQRFWRPFLALYKAVGLGVAQGFGVWNRAFDRGADEAALVAAASWICDALSSSQSPGRRDDDGLPSVVLLGKMEPFLHERLVRSCDSGSGFSCAIAGLAFERARICGASFSEESLPAEVMLWLHDFEVSVLRQRKALESRKRDELNRRADKLATHPDAYLSLSTEASALSLPTAPILEVKLFGGMEVRLGGERIDLSRIRRDKVKVLLAILVLARGRDVSRDTIVASLWPESSLASARRNYYTVWSELHSALKLPDGTCPYLIRHKDGCAIDQHFLSSDVMRFDAACRDLQFGVASGEPAPDLYRRIDEEFSADLLPAELTNEIIINARSDCREQLIDALISGAVNLTRAGCAQQATWLARSAVRRDAMREDAYIALMNAQVSLGQRTAALMTYFKCKAVLSEELGLDPSPEMNSLYEGLIDPFDRAVAQRA
jgi:DNA-binding SARP family transcriptional activator